LIKSACPLSATHYDKKCARFWPRKSTKAPSIRTGQVMATRTTALSAPEPIKANILPRICRGELCFVIGMSEPGSGSDLFAAKTKATKVDKGWLINGSKIWTSNADVADYMIALFRTSPSTNENRRHGLTQFLVDMKSGGIKINPIYQMSGQHDFNEVVFENAFVPDDHVLGEIDGAWKQATSFTSCLN
jgi:acyl-CoA dehydrogenase